MPATDIDSKPLFQLSHSAPISAPAAQVYALVSDLSRSGEWSPECRGGSWVSGGPGQLGSIFQGSNNRAADVVGWAPVVRGDWTTRSEVIDAEDGRSFHWAMLNRAGDKQESVWGFRLEPAAEGCLLTHEFQMGRPTEGIGEITSAMDAEQRQRFFTEWGSKIDGDLKLTVRRIKKLIEG